MYFFKKCVAKLQHLFKRELPSSVAWTKTTTWTSFFEPRYFFFLFKALEGGGEAEARRPPAEKNHF